MDEMTKRKRGGAFWITTALLLVPEYPLSLWLEIWLLQHGMLSESAAQDVFQIYTPLLALSDSANHL